nr:hypothetical protein HK105_005878 [Polyrhizophydium stewartii]
MIADISAATIAALVLSSAAAAAAAAGPTSVGQFSVDKPAFAKLSRTSTGTNLYLSSFQALASDAIFVADAAAAVKSPSTTSPQKLAGTVTWPNEIRDAPASLFGTEGIVAAGGFIVPGKTKGGLFFAPRFANGTHGALTQIFKPSSDWFYHRVAFYDVNKDGKLDILTCRANKPLLGSASGDLVWLQPTDRTRPTGSWTETVIGKGCDTYFIIADLNNDGKDEILSAEFWGKSLTLIQSTDASGRFDVASSLKVTKIDT